MFIKKMLISNARFIAFALCIALIIPLFNVLAAPAAVMPTVKDASGAALENRGRMSISANFDVFVDPQDGVAFYYVFDNPTIGGAAPAGSLLGSDRKITVPGSIGEYAVLYIWGVDNNAASPVFSFTFLPTVATGLVVRDEDGNVLANGGKTQIGKSIEIIVSERLPGVEYRYALNSMAVEVYYDGAGDVPSGSYFEGPFVNGVQVASRLPSNYIYPYGDITVPDPVANGVQNLKIVMSGMNTSGVVVYEHEFYATPFTVSFIDGETVYATAQVAGGGKVAPPTAPVKEYYDFIGWSLDGNALFDFETPITGDTDLFAVWEARPITSLRILTATGAPAAIMLTVARNREIQFGADINDDASVKYVSWATSNANLATVDSNGLVTIKNSIGNVTLTASAPSGVSFSIILRIS